jgi:hypothetical protein
MLVDNLKYQKHYACAHIENEKKHVSPDLNSTVLSNLYSFYIFYDFSMHSSHLIFTGACC